MRDAAIERLSKILAPNSEPSPQKKKRGRRALEERPDYTEGGLLLFLLIAVVYATIWGVQLAVTEPSLTFLTFNTALGLALGVFAAKQYRFPGWIWHLVALSGALVLAYWQGSGYRGDDESLSLVARLVLWFQSMIAGGISNDNAIFVFFVGSLGFILAYTSAWLVYRTRSPWLMIVANATVLLVSLNGSNPALIIFLVVFILASLLLLLRFNLQEWMTRWDRQGLRYADDLSWDVMQAGALISIGILIFSWILPGSYLNPELSQVWNAQGGPVSQVTNAWNRLFAVQGGNSVTNRGSFRESLALGGNPNLSEEVVFTVETKDGTPPYLGLVSYDAYNNGQWTITDAEVTRAEIPAKTSIQAGSLMSRAVELTITIQNPPSTEHPYIAAPIEVDTLSVPARILFGNGGDMIAWLSSKTLPAGTTYTVKSVFSGADIETLKTIPLPKDAPPYEALFPNQPDAPIPTEAFQPGVLSSYMQLPKNLDPRIKTLAEEVTRNTPSMYEKVEALEKHLRSTYQYSVEIRPPAGKDPVSWFLFEGKKGFCNYYSSSMALMARSLGIPARIVAGYRQGVSVDEKYVIRGKDAHSWVQVFFAGYGWVDFEPTAAFPGFTRPEPEEVKDDPSVTNPNNGNTNIPLPTRPFDGEDPAEGTGGNDGTGENSQISLNRAIIALTGTVFFVILFSVMVLGIWWRRLFRRYSLTTQIYGRVCTLANLSGIRWQPSQTPHEYLGKLSTAAVSNPKDAEMLDRLGDIYVRERWADPNSPDHPSRSGEVKDLPAIWHRLRPRLLAYMVRHPRFLFWFPTLLRRQIVYLWKRLRTRHYADDEL